MLFRPLVGIAFFVTSLASASVCIVNAVPQNQIVNGEVSVAGYSTFGLICDGKAAPLNSNIDTSQLLGSYLSQGYKIVSQSSSDHLGIIWTLVK